MKSRQQPPVFALRGMAASRSDRPPRAPRGPTVVGMAQTHTTWCLPHASRPGHRICSSHSAPSACTRSEHGSCTEFSVNAVAHKHGGSLWVVHAGMQPGLAPSAQPRDTLLNIRILLHNGTASSMPGKGHGWAAQWPGHPGALWRAAAERAAWWWVSEC